MDIMASIDGALEVLAGNIQSQPSHGRIQAALLRGQQSPSFSLMSGGQEPPPMQPMAQPQQQMPPQPPYDPQRPLRRAMAQAGQQPRPPMPQQPPPQAMQQQQPPQPQESETDAMLAAQYQRLMADRQRAAEEEQRALQPVDPARMQEMVQQRQQAAQQQTMMALAAQQAGEGFQGFQQHALGQAAQARAPLRMAGGTLTSEGWVRDEYAAHELAIKRADAKVRSIDMALERNVTAQQRAELQREKAKALEKAQEEKIEAQKFIAGIVHGGGAAQGTWSEAGTDPNTGAPVYVNNKTLASRTIGPDGQPREYQGTPSGKGTNTTEGERKAATLLQRLEFSQQQLRQAVAETPSAAKPTAASKALQRVPVVGEDAANALMSPARQRVEAAQLDLLDAALTLGTGAAYTMEQLRGYSRSYFAQPGDDDRTVADKEARLANVISAARIAAGRAGPRGSAPAPANAAPQATGGGDNAPEGATATNKQTGQKMIKRNGQWVPQ